MLINKLHLFLLIESLPFSVTLKLLVYFSHCLRYWFYFPILIKQQDPNCRSHCENYVKPLVIWFPSFFPKTDTLIIVTTEGFRGRVFSCFSLAWEYPSSSVSSCMAKIYHFRWSWQPVMKLHAVLLQGPFLASLENRLPLGGQQPAERDWAGSWLTPVAKWFSI